MLSRYAGNSNASSPQASNKPILVTLEGGVEIPIQVTDVDSPYTIADGTSTSIRTFLCDTSGGILTVNLPVTPVDGEIINIKRVTTDGNDLTIGRSGFNIEGAAADIVDTNITLVNYQLQFSSITGWWIL